MQGNPEKDKIASYPVFDWLRLALASIVVLGHADFYFAPFLTGTLAVHVFFALSGWLIGGILLKTERGELSRFFFNRASRIWIPYFLAILILYSLAAAKEGVDFFWTKYLILDVTFTHQLFTFFPAASHELPLEGSGNQFWSIAVEEQFYLIAPLIMLYVPNGKKLGIWVALAAAGLVAGLNSAAISLGVCAAIIESRTGFTALRATRWIALAAAGLFAALLAAFDFDRTVSPLFAIAVVLACSAPGRRSNVALVAGGLSYPLYLNHYLGVFAVNFVSKRYFPLDHGAFVIIQYALNVLIALALYWLVDRQIQTHRNAWYSPRLGARLGLTAYLLVASGIVAGLLMHNFGPHG